MFCMISFSFPRRKSHQVGSFDLYGVTNFFSVVRYGFRSPPHLELKARPKLGEREVTLVHITEWIEKKLDQEFQVCTERNGQQ